MFWQLPNTNGIALLPSNHTLYTNKAIKELEINLKLLQKLLRKPEKLSKVQGTREVT